MTVVDGEVTLEVTEVGRIMDEPIYAAQLPEIAEEDYQVIDTTRIFSDLKI